MQEAQRKKLGKKEHAEKEISRLRARPTLRALDQRSLFEKSDVKTSPQNRRDAPLNLNLSISIHMWHDVTGAGGEAVELHNFNSALTDEIEIRAHALGLVYHKHPQQNSVSSSFLL